LIQVSMKTKQTKQNKLNEKNKTFKPPQKVGLLSIN